MTDTLTEIHPAARVGDAIQHTSLWAEIGGAIVGNIVASASNLLYGLGGGIGIAARIGYLLYEAGSAAKDVWDYLHDKESEPSWADKARSATTDFLNECFATPDGEIVLGAKTVFINGKPAAIAGLAQSVACDDHGFKQIAEGSETVFVEGYPIARKNDKTECGATIVAGSPDVVTGSGKTAVCDIAPEFSRAERMLITVVEMSFPPSRQVLKKGLGRIRLGRSDLPKKMKKNNVAASISQVVKKAEVKSHPPFKLSEKYHTPELKKEFERQLKEQEDAINKMKVKDWLKNREEFKNRDKKEYNKRSKEARDEYRKQVFESKKEKYIEQGYSKKDAEEKANEYLKDKSVLHSPDSIAGGKYNGISGLGNSRINSSIGSQWKSRVNGIEDKVKKQYGIPPKSIDELPENAIMNVKLL